MIPKKVHYIWLGKGRKPENFSEVFESWQTFAQGFEIRLWTEEDVGEFALPLYYHQSYNQKKWAFASDVLRVFILEKYGGIYLDTDEYLLRSIDTPELLHQKSFIAKYHEVDDYFGFGFVGCVENSVFMKRLKKFYESYTGERDIIINKIGSTIASELASSGEVTIFPQEYFYPLTESDITEATYAQHLSNTSWIPGWKKVLYKIPHYLVIKNFAMRCIPKPILRMIQKIDY